MGQNIPPQYWARPAMEQMVRAGLLLGDQEGNVRIDEVCTKEEGIVLLARALKLETTAETALPQGDNTSDWAANYVGAAKKAGLVTGDERGLIHGKRGMTRGEIIVMLARSKGLSTDSEAALTPFKDRAAVAPWLRPYVCATVESGALTGYPDGTLRLDAPITRGEVYALFTRLVLLE